MRTRTLGRGGPEVSLIGFGAWEAGGVGWGPGTDDRSLEAMRAALDAGVTWIDTAEVYGDGRSEELVGRAVAGRDGALVFTKVAYFGSGHRRDEVRRAIEASLRRLGREHVDLYQIHWPDRSEATPLEETWAAMAELVDEGLVRHVGVCNFGRDLVERCEAIRHVDSVQNKFSLLWQRDRAGLLSWLEGNGTAYLAYGPLAFGLLTGVIDEATRFPDDDWRAGTQNIGYYHEFFAPEVIGTHMEKVRALRRIAERAGVSLPVLALAGALAIPGITAVIAGSRNARHVAENVRAADVRLDARTLAEIDDAVGFIG